jgi:adenosine deaminase
MTHEYLRGAQDQGLSYLQLKKMARTSLEHAFISGASLWGDGSTFTVVKECAAGKPGAEKPPALCRKFLDGSEKAQLQWKLEADFNQFESQRWPASAKAAP